MIIYVLSTFLNIYYLYTQLCNVMDLVINSVWLDNIIFCEVDARLTMISCHITGY